MADGYCHDKKQMSITLAEKDADHLRKLGEYLNLENHSFYTYSLNSRNYVRLTISSSKTLIGPVLSKFDWNLRKTYNPPNEKVFREFGIEKSLVWFIGYIDGDGCIQNQTGRPDVKISIQMHISWSNVIKYMHEIVDSRFCFKTAAPRAVLKSVFRYDICDTRLVKGIKVFAESNGLPTMLRKWDKIDLTSVHRHDKANQLQVRIFDLRSDGLTIKEVSEKLGIPVNTVGYYLYHKKTKPLSVVTKS